MKKDTWEAEVLSKTFKNPMKVETCVCLEFAIEGKSWGIYKLSVRTPEVLWLEI